MDERRIRALAIDDIKELARKRGVSIDDEVAGHVLDGLIALDADRFINGSGGPAATGLLPSNDRVERPGAASGDRSARTTGCAANGINNERTEK